MKKGRSDFEVARMTDDNIHFLNIFFEVCKRYKMDYYHATPKQREFIDAVAAHEYAMKQAHENGVNRSAVPTFAGIKRSNN